MYYVYDGSFEGLLTAIFESYYRKQQPARILCNSNLQHNLLEENIYILTDEEKASRVYNSIRDKISPEALKNVYYTYLSEQEDAGTWIYDYIRFGYKVGHKIDLYLTDDRVQNIHKTRKKVSFEAHRMLGLLRFKQINTDTYYAPISPDNNIVTLLAPHFSERLPDQNWVIHDTKRNIAAIFDKIEWYVTNININQFDIFYAGNDPYEQLWKQYFASIAIKNRINPKLQRQHMPARYWLYLVEKM